MRKNLKPSEILANPENLKCSCPETDCEWRGKCKEGIALHRFYATTPYCLEIAKEEKEQERM